jgi:general secretion pathway protein I
MDTVNWTWHKNADGFTLLEVMVALAIIAFAVVTYVHSQNTSVALLNESTNVTVATLLAQGRMVVLEGSNIPGPVEREGTFDDPEYTAFRWKERVVATPLSNILEAHVEVFWDDNRGRRSVELLSLVIRK